MSPPPARQVYSRAVFPRLPLICYRRANEIAAEVAPGSISAATFAWGYLRVILRTNRWTLDGAENFAPHGAGSPAVFSFWHEHLPLMPALAMLARRSPDYRPAPIHTLVSHHRDGRFIGTVVRQFGIEPVLGSSSAAAPAGSVNCCACSSEAR